MKGREWEINGGEEGLNEGEWRNIGREGKMCAHRASPFEEGRRGTRGGSGMVRSYLPLHPAPHHP